MPTKRCHLDKKSRSFFQNSFASNGRFFQSLYNKEIETLRCIGCACHDVASWRRVRERDRDRFGAANE